MFTYGPHYKGQSENCKGNVPVGYFSYGGPGQDVVWHDLLHGYADPCQVTRQPVNMHLKQQLCVKSAHIQEVVEEGAEDCNANVGDEKESHHLQCAPERLYQLPHQHDCEDVHHNFPEMYFKKAM